MNETYIGWDGKQYPWPPPEGWHEAIDGRWWAPGTGPNPPPQGAGTQAAPDAGAAPIGGATTVAGAGAPDHSQTSQMPVFNPGQTTAAPDAGDPTAGFAAGAAGSPTMQQPAGGPVANPDTVNYSLTDGPGVSPNANPDFEPAGKGGGILQAALIVFGMVAVALLGGLGYFYFTADDGNDTATSNSSETAAGDSTDDTTDETPDTTDPPNDDSATTDGNDDTDSTDSTAPDEDQTDDETTSSSVVDGDPQLAQFRSILSENGLTSDNLADDSIRSFATSFCGMAAEADSEEAFAATRETSVAATQSGLSDEELRLVIDAAVISFCPADAERLNIEL